MEHDERARQFIYALIQQQNTYHNHKEQMVYVLATLYTGAAAWLFVNPVKFPEGITARVFICMLTVVGVAALLLIAWQLDQRRSAAAYVDAGYVVAARWLTVLPQEDELRPDRADSRWPVAIARVLPRVSRRLVGRLRLAVLAPLLALLVLGGAALWRQWPE